MATSDNVQFSRRTVLQNAALGFGWLAASRLMSEDRSTRHGELQPADTPVKSVILLFMAGGPSHIDMFDPKPELTRLDGQEVPASIRKNFQASAVQGNGTRKLMASPFKFRRCGQSGLWASDLIPETSKQIDELCVVRSVQHDSVIHVPGEYVMMTGTTRGDRPSLGAWVNYGLGTINENLPGYVVLGGGPRPTYAPGFLPSRHQGTTVTVNGIPNLAMPHGVDATARQRQLSLISSLNARHNDRIGHADGELDARIQSYELAFRMQMSAPEAFDLTKETPATEQLYGIDVPKTQQVGRQCLLARRLVERGVRFVQIRVEGWDSHDDLVGGHNAASGKSDRPISGLIADLKQRGLLESTLLVWGGEFGRTPGVEKKGGRDHSPGGFALWFAGGSVNGGQTIGRTDEVGYTAIERVVSPSDVHATILHALGVSAEQVVYEHQGRREIATFNGGDPIREAFG